MIGLPSLRTLDGAQSARIWLATEATDMRCGFDRLAERVRAVIRQDPLLCGGPRYASQAPRPCEGSSSKHIPPTHILHAILLLSDRAISQVT